MCRVQAALTQPDENLRDMGKHHAGVPAYLGGVYGHLPPAQQFQAFLPDNLLDQSPAFGMDLRLRGKEHHTNAVLTGSWQPYAQSFALVLEKPVGHLDQNTGAIPRFGVVPAGATVTQVDQDLQGLVDDLVGLVPLDVGDHAHAAAIVLVLRRIKSVSGRLFQPIHSQYPSSKLMDAGDRALRKTPYLFDTRRRTV